VIAVIDEFKQIVDVDPAVTELILTVIVPVAINDPQAVKGIE